MTQFHYRAVKDGRKVDGAIEAGSVNEAGRKLAKAGIHPYQISSEPDKGTNLFKQGFPSFTRIKYGQFFYDLSILLQAGFNIDAALTALTFSVRNARLMDALKQIVAELRMGHRLSTAFANAPNLPESIIPLLESGENSGRLEKVISAIATDLLEQEARRAALWGALAYPLFLLAAMVMAIFMVTFYLVPSLSPIFDNAEEKKPFLLVFLSAINNAVRSNFDLIFIASALIIAVLVMAVRRPTFRARWSGMIGRLPYFGAIRRQQALARYLQAAGLLTANGVPFSQALSLAVRACPVAYFHPLLQDVRNRVVKGEGFLQAVKSVRLLDDSTLALLAVGEQANRLPDMLERSARLLDRDVKTKLDRLVSVISPVVTIGMGILVGGLIVSVMSAILSINDVALQ
ncbi:type II secretion system F family protein [Rhizobium alvei]|uniref:Type II secretion system F family protein n=1 Tax=Rhizobium alvei TaxID=1132659 RepID=A0ABT8YPK2_9HYPH|nr:type II secretion system F family protein [Rhizobium alvei]MDO6965244.1 type II secretion system F family protein [Rhizobium alvei]